MPNTAFRRRALPASRAIELVREIELFNAEYCAALDSLDVEAWPSFFTADATYRITARENFERGLPVGLVYAQGRAMMEDRAVAIARTQMFAPRYLLHVLGNTRAIDERDNGEIEAQANFLLLQTLVEGPTSVHMAGTYHDLFVRSEGGLLLKERQAVYDTTIIANDLVYPL